LLFGEELDERIAGPVVGAAVVGAAVFQVDRAVHGVGAVDPLALVGGLARGPEFLVELLRGELAIFDHVGRGLGQGPGTHDAGDERHCCEVFHL
jgi:hypothetical protein